MKAMMNGTAADSVSLDPDRLAEVVKRATGRANSDIAMIDVRQAAHRVENMTTAALTHVAGTLIDGTPWRIFVKTLRPAWDAPTWSQIPTHFHEEVRRALDWEDEPRIYTGPLSREMPGNLRLPTLYGIDRTDERIVLWLEDIDDSTPWDVAR
jgi:hypothetical protein